MNVNIPMDPMRDTMWNDGCRFSADGVLFLASLKCSVPELNYCSTLIPVLAIDGRVF